MSEENEIKTDKSTKDAEAQSSWESESKRIQEIRNSDNISEPVVEPTPEPVVETIEIATGQNSESSEINSASLLETVSDAEVNPRISFEEFTDERILISHDAFGNKQMKIKVLEVSDEVPH